MRVAQSALWQVRATPPPPTPNTHTPPPLIRMVLCLSSLMRERSVWVVPPIVVAAPSCYGQGEPTLTHNTHHSQGSHYTHTHHTHTSHTHTHTQHDDNTANHTHDTTQTTIRVHNTHTHTHTHTHTYTHTYFVRFVRARRNQPPLDGVPAAAARFSSFCVSRSCASLSSTTVLVSVCVCVSVHE